MTESRSAFLNGRCPNSIVPTRPRTQRGRGGRGFPTLLEEERKGRSEAEVCTSAARKIGAPLVRAKDGVPQKVWDLVGRVSAGDLFAWFLWCCGRELGAIQPVHVAAYISSSCRGAFRPDRQTASRLHPHALRLADHRPGHIPTNPAHSVRGPHHSVSKGATVLTFLKLPSAELTPPSSSCGAEAISVPPFNESGAGK